MAREFRRDKGELGPLASVQRVRSRFYFPRTASLHQEGDAVDVIVHTIVEHFRGALGIHAWHGGGLPELP